VDGSGIDAWKVISLSKVLCKYSFNMGNYYCRALNNPVKKAFSQVHHHNTDDLVKIGTPPLSLDGRGAG
jgi:hypothetical protein